MSISVPVFVPVLPWGPYVPGADPYSIPVFPY